MDTYIDARIHLVKDVEFSIRNEEFVDLNDVTVRIEGGRFFLSDFEKEVTFETLVKYFIGRPTDESIPLLIYKNHTIFFVDNMHEIIEKRDNQLYMNKDHIKIFMDAIIPTIRGILVEKTRGTNLEKAYLPLMQGQRVN